MTCLLFAPFSENYSVRKKKKGKWRRNELRLKKLKKYSEFLYHTKPKHFMTTKVNQEVARIKCLFNI